MSLPTAIRGLAVVAGFLASALALVAGEIFLAPGGNDSSGDGSMGNPFATVPRALNAASDGDVIRFRGGTYNDSIQVASWRGFTDLTLAAYGSEAVTIQANGTEVVGLYGSQGVTLRNLRLTGGVVGIQSGAGNLRFEGCEFFGMDAAAKGRDAAIIISGVDGLRFDGCTFADNRAQDFVFVNGTNDNVTIENCTFRDNFANNGVQQSTIALLHQNPATSIRIADNLFEFTGPKEDRPTLPHGVDAYGIFLYQCDGDNFDSPRIAITGNTIRNYRYQGTQDDTWYDPSYLKTPGEGGERAQGMALVECNSILIQGNRIESVSGHGINGYLVQYLRIEGNEFVGVGKNGIFLVGNQETKTGASPNLIADNRVRDCGWLVGGTSGISTIFPGPGNLILRNHVTGQVNGIAGTEGADWYGDGNGILADLDSTGTAIVGNVVVGNQGAGISMNRASDCLIGFNTVAGNGHCPHRADNYGLFIAGNHGPADRNRVVNNLLYNNRLGQFWVYQTALNHTVHHNLYAAGPLTLPERANLPIDWNGRFFTVTQWMASPPVAGNGVGARGSRPVFLGDLTGSDSREDPFHFLPVNDSAGTGDATPWTGLPAVGDALGFSGSEVFMPALSGVPSSPLDRPVNNANLGALEPPTSPIPFGGGDFVVLVQEGANQSWAESSRLVTRLRWNGSGPMSDGLGTLSYTGPGPGWLVSGFFGYLWFGSSEGASLGWLHSERFGWMKFERDAHGTYLWVADLQTWMVVRPDGSFYSFDFRELVPTGLKTYRSPILGNVTVGDFNGWVASDRFGWVWAARGTGGVWFWSDARQDWLGVMPDGSIWSTRDGRFL